MRQERKVKVCFDNKKKQIKRQINHTKLLIGLRLFRKTIFNLMMEEGIIQINGEMS